MPRLELTEDQLMLLARVLVGADTNLRQVAHDVAAKGADYPQILDGVADVQLEVLRLLTLVKDAREDLDETEVPA